MSIEQLISKDYIKQHKQFKQSKCMEFLDDNTGD